MLDLTNRLDLNLGEKLRIFLEADDQYLYREISLLVDRRHKMAHGLNEGLGPAKALSLKTDANRVAQWFIQELNPYEKW